jgi:hypothetical protein
VTTGDVLTRRGRGLRVGFTVLIAALLLAGTLIGSDDDFPFGPFRMYATTDQPDGTVADTRVEGVDSRGTEILLTENNTGIRRAEIEGQLDRFAADPSLLHTVADAYAERNPKAPPIVRIAVVVRWHELRGGAPTGGYHDETRAVWTP